MAEITNAVQYDVLNDGSVIKVATADFKGETIPVGTCIWDFTGLDRPGYLDLSKDHGLLQRSEYPQLWATIESMITKWGSDSASIILTDVAWLAEVAANESYTDAGDGTCGRFSRGDGSTTFRIPLIRNAFPRANNNTVTLLGQYQTDQMRPITGQLHINYASWGPENTGAITTAGSLISGVGGTGQTGYLWGRLDSSLLGGNFNGTDTHPRNVAANLLMKVVDTTTATFQQGTYELAPSTIPLRGTNGYSQDWQGAFPSNVQVSLVVPPSNDYVAAPSYGWMTFSGVSTVTNAAAVDLNCGELHTTGTAPMQGWGCACTIPVSEGDQVHVGYSNVTNLKLFFTYAKGAIV